MKQGNIVKMILTLPVLIMVAGSVNAQKIIDVKKIEGTEVKTFAGEPAQGRVDFISESRELKFSENNNEIIRPPQLREDGKYVYTCICDLNDKNKLGINISLLGNVSTQLVSVYIEEGQWLEYNVLIKETIRLQPLETTPFTSIPDSAIVKITSAYNGLIVESTTGETAAPVVNDNQTFDYQLKFYVGTPQSREIERVLLISTSKENKPLSYPLGQLTPKQVVEIVAIVLDCYETQSNIVRQHFMNGNYDAAYSAQKKLVETDDCKDKPTDITEDRKKLAMLKKLANAFRVAGRSYDKAEAFYENNRLDSAMHYHGDAYTYRNLILRDNPSDPYCLEYNRKYDNFVKSLGRILSGKIVNAVRLDMQENALPVESAYIILSEHKKVIKDGRPVPGDEKEEARKIIGESAADGTFMVAIPRNTQTTVYQLNIVTDRADWNNVKSKPYTYFPKDVDAEKNLIIKITPKSVNKYKTNKK
jgi:hypothetical protein